MSQRDLGSVLTVIVLASLLMERRLARQVGR